MADGRIDALVQGAANPISGQPESKLERLIDVFRRHLEGIDLTTLSCTLAAYGERGFWQRRFWEQVIRDDADFAAPMDCVHFNPVNPGG